MSSRYLSWKSLFEKLGRHLKSKHSKPFQKRTLQFDALESRTTPTVGITQVPVDPGAVQSEGPAKTDECAGARILVSYGDDDQSGGLVGEYLSAYASASGSHSSGSGPGGEDSESDSSDGRRRGRG